MFVLKRITYTIFTLVNLCLLVVNAYAEEDVSTLPNNLIYKGKPVNAYCLRSYNMNSAFSNGTFCPYKDEDSPHIQMLAADNDMLENGFFGYEFDVKNIFDEVNHGHAYYKWVTRFRNVDIVEIHYNEGDGRNHSYLTFYRRDEDSYRLTPIEFGEGCRNGVSHAEKIQGVLEDTIRYRINLTLADLFKLQNEMAWKIDDRDHRLRNCAGYAVYERPLNSNFLQKRLMYVQLTMPLETVDLERKYEEHSYDDLPYCAERMIKGYRTERYSKLSPAMFEQFVRQFRYICTPSGYDVYSATSALFE